MLIGKPPPLAPDSGEPLNALGSLKASEGKTAEAEKSVSRSAPQKSESAPRAS